MRRLPRPIRHHRFHRSVYKKYSEGRIAEEKKRIDLYLWIDPFDRDHLFFNMENEKLCSILYDEATWLEEHLGARDGAVVVLSASGLAPFIYAMW